MSEPNLRRNGGLVSLDCLLPHPTLTNKNPPSHYNEKGSGFPMTPTLPTSSKNKDNKHKACVVNGRSQRSMQKNKIKKEILRQILLTLPAAGQARDSQKRPGPGRRLAGPCLASQLCAPLPRLRACCSPEGIYKHTQGCVFYMYVHRPATLSWWKPPAPPREAGCRPSSHCHCWKKRTVGTS